MKLCSVEFQVDTGMLTIGAAEMSDDEPMFDVLPAVSSTRVFMSCRQQIRPVRIELWRAFGPPTVHDVVSAQLTLPSGSIGVGETFLRPYLSWPACAPGGSVAVRIGADSEQGASVVTVVLAPVEVRLPSSRDRAGLVRRLAEYGELANLDVVLAEHSFPVERCAATVRTIRRAVDRGVSAAQVRYGVDTFVEWMRWLRTDVSSQDIDGFVELVMRRITADFPAEAAARALLTEFAGRLGMSLDELLVARR